MSRDDLRLRYIVANKELATADTLRETALRAFAASFCDDEKIEQAEIVVSALSQALVELAELDHQAACDELEDGQPQPTGPVSFRGENAENFYHAAVVNLYKAAGFDQHYADEAASWPDVLNHKTAYPGDLLREFAKLEVGHDLLVGDYIRAAVANNYFKTEPLSSGAEQTDGSAQ